MLTICSCIDLLADVCSIALNGDVSSAKKSTHICTPSMFAGYCRLVLMFDYDCSVEPLEVRVVVVVMDLIV